VEYCNINTSGDALNLTDIPYINIRMFNKCVCSVHILVLRHTVRTVSSKKLTIIQIYTCVAFYHIYEGGPKNNRNLNVVRELEVVARCAARCHESTQYSSSLPRGINLG